MHSLKRLLAGCVVAVSLFCATGCQFWPHTLQPSQLWKLNRSPAPRHDPHFSVSDPIPEHRTETTDFRDALPGE